MCCLCAMALEEGDGDVLPHYDLFDSFKPEHNPHRPFEYLEQ